MDEHPEFDIVEITRKMSIDILNTVEMTSQEAAWYLLREPMSKSSVIIVYIPTVWPIERQRIRKTQQELNELNCEEQSTDIWKENWFDKYEKRPEEMDGITLAKFVANYTRNVQGTYSQRKEPRVIRYRNYDMTVDLNEYKREMVTLHLPFRNEEEEILADMKFIQIYDENEQLILEHRKEFESKLDIKKTIQIIRDLCREDAPDDDAELKDVANRYSEPNPFEDLYQANSAMNDDIRLATLNKLGAIAKKRENLMDNQKFYQLMRMANEKQRGLLLHIISHLLSENSSPLQIFFTGPAGCGKTFVIKLLMEIYNRFTNTDGYCNAFITCASTGKAAVAIGGSTVHTALKISLSKLLPLSIEVAQQYRALFKYVKVLIIDEISMIGAELLAQIDSRLKQITGNFEINFGGLDVILIGDLRQLPPVRATPIYKQIKQRIAGPTLWRGLKFYELTEVMRQANQMFSTMLTKIGNGLSLDNNELQLIESRFYSREDTDRLCPNGIRLFLKNVSVDSYNRSVLDSSENKVVSVATDTFEGCRNAEQEAFVRQKLHKMSVIDTGGLPYEVTLVLNKTYILTTNIDVSDGLANGAVGKLCHIDYNNDGTVTRVWLEFPESPKTGEKLRRKVAAYREQNNINRTAVPIARRTSAITMNNNKTMFVRRSHLPLVSACAITIHKSQGGTFNEVVYEYDKTHSQQLVYVALSRVTSIEGLYIVMSNNDSTFYHGRRKATSMVSLQEEFRRLSLNRLVTIEEDMTHFISSRRGLSVFSLNCQSLSAHVADFRDTVTQRANILLLSETWLKNEDTIHIPNFDCVCHFKRPSVRSGGVAIYRNSNNGSLIITPHLDLTMNQSTSLAVNATEIGEMCAAYCTMENGQKILLATVYISPGSPVAAMIAFIQKVLVLSTPEVAAVIGSDDDKIPIFLTGDFNVDFASEDAKPLIEFLKQNLNLTMNNNATEGTTRYGTTIDAVFSRFLDRLHSRVFISYFSYHKPIVSFLADGDDTEN